MNTGDCNSPNQEKKSMKSKYLNSQAQNKEKISLTQSYFNQNHQYQNQRATPDGMLILNEANSVALNHLKRPNINQDRGMGLKNEKRKNDQGNRSYSPTYHKKLESENEQNQNDTYQFGRIIQKNNQDEDGFGIQNNHTINSFNSLWSKDPLMQQQQIPNKKVGKVDSNLGFQNLQNFNWVKNNDLVGTNVQKNRPSTRDSFKESSGLFGRINNGNGGQRPRIEMSSSPGNEGSQTNIVQNGRPQTRSGGGRPTTSGIAGHVVIQENFRADGGNDFQFQQQLLEQNFPGTNIGPQILKRPNTRGNQVVSQSLYDSFKRESSPVSAIKKGEQNIVPDEYRQSPQKISKYERNDFKRPVIIQGALKRGAKHTMESIEEEDENQIQNERVKTATKNSQEQSSSNLNHTYVSVTPTPPKNEARKTSQNNINTTNTQSQIYSGVNKNQKHPSQQRKNNALNSSVQGAASVVFSNNQNAVDFNRRTFYNSSANQNGTQDHLPSMNGEANTTKSNFYKLSGNLNEYDFNSQHSTSQTSGGAPGALSNKRSPRVLDQQNNSDLNNIKNSSFYQRPRQNIYQKQHETQIQQTQSNIIKPTQKFGLKTVTGGFFNPNQVNQYDDSAYQDNLNTSQIGNNQLYSSSGPEKMSQNSNRSDQQAIQNGSQVHQQQKIYQIIKNQQENLSSSITRNTYQNQQSSIGNNNYSSTNPTNTSTVNSNHRSISPIMFNNDKPE
eukprot:403346450